MTKDQKIGVGFGVLVLKDNRVLLGKRHDDPAKASSLLNGAGTWTMPGGKLHFGESFEAGAKREVLEETSLELNKVQVISINNDMVETAHFVTIGLLSDNFSGQVQVREPEEITEWRWFSLNDLPAPLYFPSARILENYRQQRFYTDFS